MAMERVCRIVADVRERASDVPTILRLRGAAVTVSYLAYGDSDLGAGILVERKAVRDLHESMREGRLWPQLGRLRAHARVPCLIVEGWALRGPVSERASRAALLAASDLGILMVRTVTKHDTADWLVAIAARGVGGPKHRVRPAYAQRSQPTAADVPQAMLAAVPGISHEMAIRLLRAFGSVAGVVAAPDEALLRVAGMGKKRLSAFREAVSSVLPQ